MANGGARGGGIRWSNWSGSVHAAPRELLRPTSVAELARQVAALAREGRHVRVVGAGHSFTPLAQSDDALMTLESLQGIEAVDAARGSVTVLGGTQLKRLGAELHAHGLAQENLGDIDVQSISGAISTGTHGTGADFGTIATQVTGLTLVTASGELLECSAERHPDIFKAAQVSLGALGVIASVTLRVVPSKRLHYISRRERLSTCLANLERYKAENSHFEFFWFPYTDAVQAKFTNETDAPPSTSTLWGRINEVVLENGAFWLISEISRSVPRLSPAMCQVAAWGITPVDEVNYSHLIFATPRAVRFQEMEYSIPAQHFTAVIGAIQEVINTRRFEVNFPVECRFVRGDDIWLSPAYQRDSAYVAVHMYRGMPYQDYFRAIEEIFTRYDGRPHWGKMHTRDAAYLAAHYPHWDNFRRVRAALDPQGVFLNDYLRRLLDAETPVPSAPEPRVAQ
jgi:FAD-linked oxidoreductase